MSNLCSRMLTFRSTVARHRLSEFQAKLATGIISKLKQSMQGEYIGGGNEDTSLDWTAYTLRLFCLPLVFDCESI